MTEASRYDGKPLLRLLELYVLWAIGEIWDLEEQKLEDMTPKLRSIYKMEGSWHEIIASIMHFPADLADGRERNAATMSMSLPSVVQATVTRVLGVRKK